MRCVTWIPEEDSLGRKRVGRQCGNNTAYRIIEKDSGLSLVGVCREHAKDFQDNADSYVKEPIV